MPAGSIFKPVGSGLFSALTDYTGTPYEPNQLPCVADPDSWDEDAHIKLRRHAAKVCRTGCPALVACRTRRLELGPWATGVWAGEVIPVRHHSPTKAEIGAAVPDPAEGDALIARYLDASGIAAPATREARA